jgi:trimeric autotransporter adhesin
MKKKLLFILLILVIIANKSKSQCNTNTSICTPGVAGPFTFNPPGPVVSSCLNFIGTGYGYILLHITSSGNLNMLINGNNTTGFIDVSIFNIPQGVAPCVAIQNLANEIGCNYASTATGCNQFGTSFPCGASVPAPFVTAGQTLMIVVEDWSNQHTNYTLQLGPGAGTGPYNTTINPAGPFCLGAQPSNLTAMTVGGVWTGAGITNSSAGTFNPSVAGPGSHTISYSIGGTCGNTSTQIINVSTPEINNHYDTICSGEPLQLNTAIQPTMTAFVPVTFMDDVRRPVKNLNTCIAPITITGLNAATVTMNSIDSVCMTVMHPRISDLEVKLRCPSGNLYNLSMGNGGVGANYINTCFKMGAPIISTGTPPYTGIFAPQGAGGFGSLNGCNINGTWNLEIYDGINNAFEGSLERWSLTLKDEIQVPNNNFSWSNTAYMNDSTIPNPIVAPIASSNYSAIGYDAFGCALEDHFFLEVHPNQVSVNSPVYFCQGDSVQLVAMGALTYSWSQAHLIDSPASPNSKGLFAETTTVYVTTIDSNNCTRTTPVVAEMEDYPIADAGGPYNICLGSCLQIEASGGVNYQWINHNGEITNNNISNPVACPSFSRNYEVEVFSLNGCKSTATVSVVVNPAPAFTTNGDQTICLGSSANLILSPVNPNANYNYSWTPTTGLNDPSGSNVISTPSGNNDATLTYTVTAFDGGSCSFTQVINVHAKKPQPLNNVNTVEICQGTSGTFNALTPDFTGYSWTPADGLSASNTPNPAVSGSFDRCYEVSANDPNGCPVKAPACLKVKQTPIVNPGPPIIVCPNSTAQLNAIVSPSSATVTWSSSAAGVGYTPGNTVTNPEITLPGGTTTQSNTSFTVTANLNGCQATGTVNVAVAGQPISITETNKINVTCFGGNNGAVSVTVAPTNPGYAYAWSPAGAPGPNAMGLTAGLYVVTVTDPISQCQARKTIDITQPRQMKAHFSTAPEYCGYSDGKVVVDSISFAQAPISYAWSTAPVNNATINNVKSGWHKVTATDGRGCKISDSTWVIAAGDAVLARFNDGLSPDAILYPPLTVNFTNQTINGVTYEWDFGNGQTSTSKDPVAIFDKEGEYKVVLKAKGQHCVDTVSQWIVIKPELKYQIPNVFSPNGDKKNDVFTVNGFGMKEFKGEIFTRWGNKIFEWEDPQKGWTGEGYEDGVYFYVISFTPYVGDSEKLTGHVSMFR